MIPWVAIEVKLVKKRKRLKRLDDRSSNDNGDDDLLIRLTWIKFGDSIEVSDSLFVVLQLHVGFTSFQDGFSIVLVDFDSSVKVLHCLWRLAQAGIGTCPVE